MSSSVEKRSTVEIHHFLIDLTELKEIIGIFFQKDSLMIGLNSLPKPILSFKFSGIFYFISKTLVNDLVL